MVKKQKENNIIERIEGFKEVIENSGRAVIQKRIVKSSALTGNILETKELSVEGNNLKEVRNIFQEEWAK